VGNQKHEIMLIAESRTDVICENKDIVRWQPIWDKHRFLASLDDEIDDFLELGLPKSSLLSSVRSAAGK
jgi:hypothetical protein